MFQESNASKSISRLIYTTEKEFYVVDGDGISKSTNGTWLFTEKEHALENNSEIMVGQSLFRIEIYI